MEIINHYKYHCVENNTYYLSVVMRDPNGKVDWKDFEFLPNRYTDTVPIRRLRKGKWCYDHSQLVMTQKYLPPPMPGMRSNDVRKIHESDIIEPTYPLLDIDGYPICMIPMSIPSDFNY